MNFGTKHNTVERNEDESETINRGWSRQDVVNGFPECTRRKATLKKKANKEDQDYEQKKRQTSKGTIKKKQEEE